MRATLKTTTAILASLALIAPTTLPAQTTDAPIVACPEGTEPPCPETTESSGDTGSGTAEQTVTEEAPTEEPVAEEAPTEEPVAEETPTDAPVVEETVTEQAPADAPVVEETVTDEAPADAPVVEETVIEEAPTEAPLVEEANEEEAPVEQPVVEETAPEAPVIEAPVIEEAAEPAPETPVVVEETAPAVQQTLGTTSTTEATPTEPAVTTETTTAPAPQDPLAGIQGQPTAEAAALAGMSDAGSAPAGADEVETETVTEDSARSSDEDFQGGINAEAGTAAATESDGGGLSKFEKALLLGAGALAVGAIVRGNRQVQGTSQDRVVVSSSDGSLEVLKDDNALLRQPGNQIETRTFDDGSTRTVTTRPDGSQVITVRDADLRVIRRVLIGTDGTEVVLIDDSLSYEPVDVSTLPAAAPEVVVASNTDLRTALEREGAFDRRFSLAQIRQINEVRKLAPVIAVDTITFESGSAAIQPEQARSLTALGTALAQLIDENPNEVFLVEGHTDAVGSASTNLILSDRRAESLALALTEYFDVPPENLVVQGYGESDLRVATDASERANRRAGVRRITDLMQLASR